MQSSAMFIKPTTIIVGAGASIEFGLPSGKDVFQSLGDTATELSLDQHGKSALFFTKQSPFSPPHESMGFKHLMRMIATDKPLFNAQLSSIAGSLKFQFDDSIDEYLFNNLEHQEIGKLFSVWRIACSLYVRRDTDHEKYISHISRHQELGLLHEPQLRSWLASLAKKLTEGCKTLDDLKKNKLTLIIFNYDQLIEDGLLSLIKASQRFAGLIDLNFLKVLHVNGTIDLKKSYKLNYHHNPFDGDKFFVDKSFFDDILSNTEKIFMTNDDVPKEIKAERRKASNAIANSEKIFSLGFAFDPNNVLNIGLDKLFSLGKTLFALTYNDDISIKNRIKAVLKNNNTVDGTASNPMGCSQACALGFLDQ